jgi:hypothetical protein
MNTAIDISEYVHHNEKYRVLICRQCKDGIPPSNVERHLRGDHKSIPIKTRNTIVEWASTLRLCEPSRVETPPEEEGPIPYLELIEKGYQCRVENCRAYRSTLGGIERHSYTHGWRKGGEKLWDVKCLQRFYLYNPENNVGILSFKRGWRGLGSRHLCGSDVDVLGK